MKFQNAEEIAREGFTGFVSVSKLQASNCREVPDERGVYLFLCPNTHKPKFLQSSRGGHFKGHNPTVLIAKLQAKWVLVAKVAQPITANESPHRPNCDSKLVARTAKGGSKPGSKFWGCPNYPNCRGMVAYKHGAV